MAKNPYKTQKIKKQIIVFDTAFSPVRKILVDEVGCWFKITTTSIKIQTRINTFQTTAIIFQNQNNSRIDYTGYRIQKRIPKTTIIRKTKREKKIIKNILWPINYKTATLQK